MEEVLVKPGRIPRGRGIDRQDLTLILRREKYRMDLMEQILSRENMLQALCRVEANKGAAGIDSVRPDNSGHTLFSTGKPPKRNCLREPTSLSLSEGSKSRNSTEE